MYRARLFAVIIIASISSWGGSVSAAEKIRLVCNEFPPQKMEASEDGKPGFDIEYLQEAFSRLDIALEIEFRPWRRAMEGVENGDFEGFCSCSRRVERDDWLAYSDPMGTVGIGVFLRNGPNPASVTTLEDLKSVTTAVVRAYTLHDELVEAGVSAIPVTDDSKGLRMLLNGRVQAFVTFRETGFYLLSQLGPTRDVDYVEFRASPYFMCLRRSYPGYEALLDRFNKVFAEMKDDGTVERISSRYR
ncbi:amino acid ABC transporter substrate-binding protein [Rhodospirillaceae bacterium KN72]|uniref:Amino acid ABC transporter substrate-binding protein n=1 Tax=Pacificispira spongiicola TaxID=2729598 RepID=A0A7Y0E1R3_9PROT|nr:transporter substrate-binding domain-containing protein [Pacificispira spongiicola]NMM45614.1 amino acid ABC transporter substrate-binding protein [Pacificispira spongiicola]